MTNVCKLWVEETEGRDHLEDLYIWQVNGKINLKRVGLIWLKAGITVRLL